MCDMLFYKYHMVYLLSISCIAVIMRTIFALKSKDYNNNYYLQIMFFSFLPFPFSFKILAMFR